MKVAFYAPMNAPDDGPPSGDRLIARQLIDGLSDLGHSVEIPTRLKTWRQDPGGFEELKDQAAAHVSLLHEQSFDAWVTYHVYYKAPDLIGPWIARAKGIPYYMAEASLAPSRMDGPWAEHYTSAREAMDVATRIFCISPRDRPALENAGLGAKLVDLAPWVDAKVWDRPRANNRGPVQLVTTAMMREGDKVESYELLSRALPKLTVGWAFTIYGDGPARRAVEKLFAPFGEKVTFKGLADPFTLAEAYANADLFAWPGLGEGLGMTYLEAQAAGLPCVACNGPGPHGALDDATARFTQQTPDAYAWAMDDLARNKDRREAMGKAAKRFVSTRFSRERYLHTLRDTLTSHLL